MGNELFNQSSRRSFLKSSTLIAAASTVGFGGMFGLRAASAAAAPDGDDIPTMLNVAATAETFACTHYYRALNSKIGLSEVQIAYVKAALESELDHLEFLNANGGKALTEKFFFPAGTFASVKSFGTVTAIAEPVFIGAYIAASHRFAELGQPALSAVATQVAVVEGEHLFAVRQFAGELVPNNIALGEPLFYNVSDAVPAVQPLLDGKKGALGDMETTSVAYPGADAIRKLIGKSLLKQGVKPFTDLKAPAMAATMGATMQATMAATKKS